MYAVHIWKIAIRSGRLLECLLACYLAMASSTLRAQATLRTGDAFWRFSSRALPDCPATSGLPNFTVHQLGSDGCQWTQRSQEELLALLYTANAPRIVIYVHGNWMSPEVAQQRAWIVYRKLVQSVDCEPICFVAYTWPSERSEGFARDIVGKKSRLDTDSFYLAKLVSSLPSQCPLGLIGYSFGSPVVCGALHLLGGGPPLERGTSAVQCDLQPVRVSLIAPAFDRTSLAAGGRYSLALSRIDKLVNTYNSVDPVLKRFRFFDRDTSPTAAGFAGILQPRVDSPLQSHFKIEQYDCCCIGRTHAELDYMTCPAVIRSLKNAVGL